jgi:hypothetical protein
MIRYAVRSNGLVNSGPRWYWATKSVNGRITRFMTADRPEADAIRNMYISMWRIDVRVVPFVLNSEGRWIQYKEKL